MRSTYSKRAPRSCSFSSQSLQNSAQIIQFAGQCLLVALRILPRFFAGMEGIWKERAPSIRFSRGMYYVAFSLILTPSLGRSRSLFSLCLYFAGAAVICCDKAASTGDARISRVEGHAPSFPTRALFRRTLCTVRPIGGEFMIYL